MPSARRPSDEPGIPPELARAADRPGRCWPLSGGAGVNDPPRRRAPPSLAITGPVPPENTAGPTDGRGSTHRARCALSRALCCIRLA